MMTENQLRAQINTIRSRSADAKSVIGISAPSRWNGSNYLEIDGERFRVISADTVLEMRSALLDVPGEDARPVVLTSLAEKELGEDLICRFARRRIFHPSTKDLLCDLFRVRDIDPQLQALGWMASALAEAKPEGGYASPPQGVLDQESAWAAYLRASMGLETARPDLVTLIHWSRSSGHVLQWQNLEKDAATAIEAWIARSAGLEAHCVWAALRRGNASLVLSLGLVADLLFQREDVPTDIAVARGRYQERYFDGLTIDVETGRKFARAARGALVLLGESAESDLIEADRLMAALGIEARAWESDFSPNGWTQRLAAFGRSLSEWLASPNDQRLETMLHAGAQVGSHRMADRDLATKDQIEMALRLVRWLKDASAGQSGSGFEAACQHYERQLSFVDWARYQLFHGHAVLELNGALESLVHRVGELRESFNEQFAKAADDWTKVGSASPTVGLIEDVLPERVAPLLKQSPVLFVILDGLSYAIHRQIAAALVRENWAEAVPEGQSRSKPVVAGIPTITEWSRRLLIAGHAKLAPGADEVALFRDSPAFHGVLRANQAPLLFRKNELTDDGGRSVSAQLRETILDKSRPLVGVVINAIDDHLAKDDQLRVAWPLGQIPILSQSLDLARNAGRAVVIASDHGHVVTHKAKLITTAPNDRYRAPTGKPTSVEIHLAAGRATQFRREGVFVPWTERGYYTSRRNGLHGGISPQELLVPAAVFVSGTEAPAGWNLIPQQYPGWWWETKPQEASPPARTFVPPARKTKATLAADSTLPLFASQAGSVDGGGDWVERLFATKLYQEQYARVGRNPPNPETIRRVLVALKERQGTLLKSVLAQASGEPEIRLPGLLAMMRRILNVEGYQILSVEEASGTVRLNLDYLKTQFEVTV